VTATRRARTRGPATTLTADQLLARYSPGIRALTERLRKLVRSTAPEAVERVYPGWRGLGYRDREAGFFCGIFPFRDHVSIVFQHGTELEDPDDILVGDTKRVRWVPIRAARDLRLRPLRAMIVRALIHGATRR